MFSVADLNLVPYPHPALRWKAVPLKIPFENPQLVKEVVAKMFDLMYENRGVGLAATQIGLPWQIFVTDVGNQGNLPPPPKDISKQLVFINPAIYVPKFTRQRFEVEGCLSIPGFSGGEVERPHKDVTIEAYTVEGKKFTLNRLNGKIARVVLHEYDHLHGVLFTDLMKTNREQADQLARWLNYLKTQYDWIQNRLNKLPPDDQIKEDLQNLEKLINEPKNDNLTLAVEGNDAIIPA